MASYPKKETNAEMLIMVKTAIVFIYQSYVNYHCTNLRFRNSCLEVTKVSKKVLFLFLSNTFLHDYNSGLFNKIRVFSLLI